MNRYIKIPLIFAVSNTAILGSVFWICYGTTTELINLLVGSCIAGGITGFVLVFIHNKHVKRLAPNSSAESFNVHQRKGILLCLPYNQAFDLCKESLSVVNGRLKQETRDEGHIKAETGFTLENWREIISYDIRQVDAYLTEIEVSSRPLLRTMLLDDGKNLENVERIIKFLTEHDAPLDAKAISSALKVFHNPASDNAKKLVN